MKHIPNNFIVRAQYTCIMSFNLKNFHIMLLFFYFSYFIDWYSMPIEAKKMLMILRIRAANYKNLSAGPVFTMSLNNFLWVIIHYLRFANS